MDSRRGYSFDASDNFAVRAATEYVEARGLRPHVDRRLAVTHLDVYGPRGASLAELDEHLVSLGARVLTNDAPND
ncbi:hypothetical protein GCM10027030_00600 [Luteococcus sediminum]